MEGVTLIELVLVMVIVGIIVAATVYFFYPMAQSVDVKGRAELTDIADNALQRIGREARLALPNSIRTATFGNQEFVEFLPIRTAGRYRGDGGGLSGGTDCPNVGGAGQPASDQLQFAVTDTCFKTIGTVVDVGTITTNDFIVLNNYGPGFAGQNAYALADPFNRRKVSAVDSASEATRVKFTFVATAQDLDRSLHDSPGRRFFVVVGNATTGLPEPVTYECNKATGKLIRRWGYTMVETPTSLPTFGGASATSADIAQDVSDCHFDYDPNVAPQIGLLTMRLKLQKAVSGSTQTVTLYQSVHISNVP